MSSVTQNGRGRINLGVNPDEEARLRAAAEASGGTLTGFLLAVERAEVVSERAGRIAVSGAAFDRFLAALDASFEPMPTLSRYAEGPSPIPPR